MSDARVQQIAAAIIAIAAMIGYIALKLAQPDEAGDIALVAIMTAATGYLFGNARTNGIAGSKVERANEALASAIADKVAEKVPTP